jgi:hypothetical protein
MNQYSGTEFANHFYLCVHSGAELFVLLILVNLYVLSVAVFGRQFLTTTTALLDYIVSNVLDV